ncbi:MAG TPA: hypothetical protein VF944_08070 [Candidatus Bathyarchaeia archaeon]
MQPSHLVNNAQGSGAMAMVRATRPIAIIGETVAREVVRLFDGRYTVFVGWLSGQRGKQCVNQYLAAAFEEFPFDCLCGIVESKRRKDDLEMELSEITLAGWITIRLRWRMPRRSSAVPGLHPMHDGQWILWGLGSSAPSPVTVR